MKKHLSLSSGSDKQGSGVVKKSSPSFSRIVLMTAALNMYFSNHSALQVCAECSLAMHLP